MAKQTFTTGQVLTAAQMTSLQETAMGGGPATAKTASYVLVAADAGTTVAMNAAGATTITVNTGLFAAGDTVFIQNLGAGACTVTAGTATVATAGSLILPQNDAGILYFTATGAAIFYDYIQAGAVSPLTTKGDVYGFSTVDARIPVGANDTVLTADSTQALGVKWATPSAGAGNLAQIASGTLSGATGATLTGLTSYSELIFKVDSVTWGTGASQFLLRLNANSTSNYAYYGWGLNSTPTYYPAAFNNGDTCFRLNKNNNQANADTDNNYFIKLTNCKTTGFTDVSILSSYDNSGGQTSLETYKGVFKVSAAISSIDLLISAGYSFSAGNYVLWGA